MNKKVPEKELRLHERILAAGAAACVSSILVNPLDVVKTRMQAQATAKPRLPGELFSTAGLESRRWMLTVGEYNWPVRNPQESPLYISRPPTTQYRSTLDGLVQIVRKEGFQVLYRGMDMALLVGVPMVCLYLPAYDTLHSYISQQGAGNLSPLLAGCLARSGAVLATSPFELFKTRLQGAQSASKAVGDVTYQSVWRSLALHKQAGVVKKVQTLWMGVGATLLKDVPFAGLYWSLLEPCKCRLEEADLGPSLQHNKVLFVNAASGAAAGGIAAAMTIPFDVVKTHTQTQALKSQQAAGISHALLDIARKRGVSALFAGWAPRSIRTAVAYAVLMGSYEQCKHLCTSDSPCLPNFHAGAPRSEVSDIPPPANARL